MRSQTREIKDNLAKYIEREFVSVRRRTDERYEIKITHRIGAEQAYAHRKSLEKDFDLFFYGVEIEGEMEEIYSVRISLKNEVMECQKCPNTPQKKAVSP